jgi:hypothetical protein
VKVINALLWHLKVLRGKLLFTLQSGNGHKVVILIISPLSSQCLATQEESMGLTLPFVNELFVASMVTPWQQSCGTYNKFFLHRRGLQWNLCSLIFYNTVIHTKRMDGILGTMIVFSGGKPPQMN